MLSSVNYDVVHKLNFMFFDAYKMSALWPMLVYCFVSFFKTCEMMQVDEMSLLASF